jgi:uroporphyrinogen III methyltransferase / synthase
MKNLSAAFRAGTRNSQLARIQTRLVLERIQSVLPDVSFRTVEITTPGDTDRTTDLRESPADFFTRTLDDALRAGQIDFAVHSAKDLPAPVPDGIDWFRLPDAGDRRDCLVGSLSPKVIGVSSDRRVAYAQKRFPGAVCRPVRGNIGGRLQQLDEGTFDLLIMAGAALQRLGLEERITEWIPLDDLEPPEAQGALAVTFRQGDLRLSAIRSLFIKSAVFVGAGVTEGHCTLDGIRALQSADICLYDALMDDSLLNHLPEQAQKRFVGKRRGEHSQSQDETNRMLCDEVRKGKRVVRLKGGDPGIFGRLAEEIEALDALRLASRVIPGISAIQTAAADTGILLTRRGTARGFSVMTPRLQGGELGSVGAQARAELPILFFMAIGVAGQLAGELIADGLPGDTPCALIFDAGSDREAIYRGRLNALPEVDEPVLKRPGLFVVGEIARFDFDRTLGALRGQRILLTCSDALMDRAVQSVYDFGGRPVVRPLIELNVKCGEETAFTPDQYDWIALTSPSAVRCFRELLLLKKTDFRRLPKLMTTGSGTARALQKTGLGCDLMPERDFSGAGLLEAAAPVVKGQRILRLRSQKAGPGLADGLRAAGADVTDCVLYENRFICYDRCPEFDAVFFASSSAVDSFVSQWGAEALQGKTVLAIGTPTQDTLYAAGRPADLTGRMADVEESIRTLAARLSGFD